MGLSPADYQALLIRSLPPGRAFSKQADSKLAGLLLGLSQELSRVDQRAEDLEREARPAFSVELLPEWEALLGLPDLCAPAPTTTAGRQAAVLAKLGALGDPRPEGLIALAAKFGITITIEEKLWTDCATGDCNDPVYGPDWVHAFFVKSALGPITEADCNGPCIAPLRDWSNLTLECLIAGAKPAHTSALFIYE